jgi:hypothetical protein
MMVSRYGLNEYTHWLLKSSPIPEVIPLHPKVYLEDRPFMKDYKNNFVETGHKHKNENNMSMIKSTIRVHEFSELPEYFYKDHKHLASMLEAENCPCVVLVNGSNNRMIGVRNKFGMRHKFVSIVDDN